MSSPEGRLRTLVEHGGHGGHGGGSASGGSATTPADLDVDVSFPRAGLYKMFMQVKRGDRIVTAPFVLRATEM